VRKERVIFPGCAARAALKASLEKGLTERLIIGSNDAACAGANTIAGVFGMTPR
jgi:hypothetical protein